MFGVGVIFAYGAGAYAKKRPLVSPAVRAEISDAVEAYRLPAPIAFDNERLDVLEARILDELPPVHMPVTHRFTPGLYIREIFNPAGALIATQIHLTEHPFAVLEGRLRVFAPGGEPIELSAGHFGITLPGTRRAILALEDSRFVTFHPLTRDEEEARAAGAPEAELVETIGNRILGNRERADGRDVFAEYKEKLAAAGLPGPNDGAVQLPEGGIG